MFSPPTFVKNIIPPFRIKRNRFHESYFGKTELKLDFGNSEMYTKGEIDRRDEIEW